MVHTFIVPERFSQLANLETLVHIVVGLIVRERLSNLAFTGIQESNCGWRVRYTKPGNDSQQHCRNTLDDEKESPIADAGVDMSKAIGKGTTICIG